MASITVLVAARRSATRAACTRALARERGVEVVGFAGSALDVVHGALTLHPRVVVLEASLGPRALTPLLGLLRASAPDIRVLVVGARVPASRLLDTLAYGSHGHLERDRLGARLARAVRAVAAGEAWLSRKLVPNVLSRIHDPSTRGGFRPRVDHRRGIGPWFTTQGRVARSAGIRHVP